MERLLLLFLILWATIAYGDDHSGAPGGPRKFKLPAGISSQDYVPNTIIIKFRAGQRSTIRTKNSSPSLPTLKSGSIQAVIKLFHDPPAHATVYSSDYKKADVALIVFR